MRGPEEAQERAQFWQKHEALSMNDRQRLLLNKMLDGFEGNLTSSRWAKIARCSQDTDSLADV